MVWCIEVYHAMDEHEINIFNYICFSYACMIEKSILVPHYYFHHAWRTQALIAHMLQSTSLYPCYFNGRSIKIGFEEPPKRWQPQPSVLLQVSRKAVPIHVRGECFTCLFLKHWNKRLCPQLGCEFSDRKKPGSQLGSQNKPMPLFFNFGPSNDFRQYLLGCRKILLPCNLFVNSTLIKQIKRRDFSCKITLQLGFKKMG